MNNMNGDTNNPEQKKPLPEKALRTFAGDIQEAVDERNASMASMADAERKEPLTLKAEDTEDANNPWKKIAIVAGCIILVAAGAAVAYYLYMRSPLAPSAPAAPTTSAPSTVVQIDATRLVDITGLNQGAARAAVRNALASAGGQTGITQIMPTQKTGGVTNALSATESLGAIGVGVPDMLLRSLNPQWMLGNYAGNDGAIPFIILKDNFFQNAYAGMIAWEKSMADDLAPIFGYSSATSDSNGTSTVASYFGIQGTWQDGVIMNKDIRSFEKPDGTVLLLYSFVDNGTIVITTDPAALTEILNRLEKQTFIR